MRLVDISVVMTPVERTPLGIAFTLAVGMSSYYCITRLAQRVTREWLIVGVMFLNLLWDISVVRANYGPTRSTAAVAYVLQPLAICAIVMPAVVALDRALTRWRQ